MMVCECCSTLPAWPCNYMAARHAGFALGDRVHYSSGLIERDVEINVIMCVVGFFVCLFVC